MNGEIVVFPHGKYENWYYVPNDCAGSSEMVLLFTVNTKALEEI